MGVTEKEAQLSAENKELRERLAVMAQQMEWLKRQLFGRKSEQREDPHQGRLPLEEEAEEDPPAPAAKPAPARRARREGKRQTRAQKLPEHLPVREEVIVPLFVQSEPAAWRRMGEEVHEQLEKEPGYFYKRRIVRLKYVKRDEPHTPPVVAPAPPALIEGGFLGATFLTEIILEKYLCHQPFYRQAQSAAQQHGIALSRQTLCDAAARLAALCAPVVRAMEQNLWRGGYVQMDETFIRCLDRERPGGSFRGYLWTCAGPPGSDVIFKWDEGRSAAVADAWLPADYCGIIQRDGYSAYVTLAKKRGDSVQWAGCWAHARRKFIEALDAHEKGAGWFVHQIRLLYAVESECRERGHSATRRQRERAARSRMIVQRLRAAMQQKLPSLRPRSPLRQAIAYALGQWDALTLYLREGIVEIDNNELENAIRPTAIGKKNWLFIGHPEAGWRAAVFYSLLGSCLRRKLNPRQYLHWLFERLPTATNQTVASLTPQAYGTWLQVQADAQKHVA
jgi:transposase